MVQAPGYETLRRPFQVAGQLYLPDMVALIVLNNILF